ncbi:hypothetical protein LINPERHAP2_LOCUS32701 [Linum perenne]
MTWVRLPKLPIHYFNDVAVSRIGNYIGKTIRMDLATSEGARARYARVCIELDLTKPLLGKYMIDGRVFHIEYESLGNICFTCGIYGHKDDGCSSKAQKSDQSSKSVEVPEKEVEAEADIGSWMTVCRRHKNRSVPSKQNLANQVNSGGSRFEMLSTGNANSSSTMASSGSKGNAAPTVPKSVSDNTDYPAGVLKRILDAALARENTPPSTGHHRSNPQRNEPLKDVTNSGSMSKAKKGDGGKQIGKKNVEVEFVSVPVTYGNPTFQADVSVTDNSKKAKVTRSKAGNLKPKASSSGNRRLEQRIKGPSKRLMKFTVKANSRLEYPVETKDGLKSGKPPDVPNL